MFCIQKGSRKQYETPPIKRNNYMDIDDQYKQRLMKNHSQQRVPNYNLKENERKLHLINDKVSYSKSCLENYEVKDKMRNITNVSNFNETSEMKCHSKRLFNICQQHYKENMKTLCDIVRQQSVQTMENENHYKKKYKKAVEKLRNCELQSLDFRNENLKLQNVINDLEQQLKQKKERNDYLITRNEKLQNNLDELSELFKQTKTTKQQEIDDLIQQNEQYKNDLDIQFKELESQITDLQQEYDKILKKERAGLSQLQILQSSLTQLLLRFINSKDISLELLTQHRKRMPQIEWNLTQLQELDKNCQIVNSLVENASTILDQIADYYVSDITAQLNDRLIS